MTSLPGMQWGYIGSLGRPEGEEMKSPTGSQGVALFSGLLDRSPSWGSIGRIYEDAKLDGETASGIVAWPLQYTETGPGIDLWP